MKDGKAVRAKIEDWVIVGPPNQWGATRRLMPRVKDWSSVHIVLERTGCWGRCPQYEVSIEGSGRVTYTGREFVAKAGTWQARIPEKDVRALVAAFREKDYFSTLDEYRGMVNDLPTVRTSIAFDGRRKQVEDCAGFMVGMPDEVIEIERRIDEVAGTKRWTEE